VFSRREWGGGGFEWVFEGLVSVCTLCLERCQEKQMKTSPYSLQRSWGGCCHLKYELPRLTGPQDRVEN
jgi:hypothetical protein